MSTLKLARKGFTLIELLVVIAIIGILATLVITQVASAQVRARNSQAQSDISQAGKGVETFKSAQAVDSWGLAGTSATGSVNVLPFNAGLTAVNANAAAILGSSLPGSTDWTNRFQNGLAASTFPTLITKTPSASYRYGFMTDATAGSTGAYCVGTNVVNTSGVTGALGFIIRNGTSINAANAEPNWNTGNATPWAPSTSTATPCN